MTSDKVEKEIKRMQINVMRVLKTGEKTVTLDQKWSLSRCQKL